MNNNPNHGNSREEKNMNPMLLAAVSLPFAIVDAPAAVTPPVAVVRQTPEGIPTPPTLSC